MSTALELNPQLKWSKRKIKGVVSGRFKKLRLNSYALGCRGHPGVVIERYFSDRDVYGSDCVIKSLIDGVEESCSIFHCAPCSISKTYAEWLTKPFNYKADSVAGSLQWFIAQRLGYAQYPITEADGYDLSEGLIEFEAEVEKLVDLIEDDHDRAVYARIKEVYEMERRAENEPRPKIDLGYRGDTFL